MPDHAAPTLTDGQARTLKARKTVMRRAEERKAEILRSRGWTCTPPEDDTPAKS